MTVCVLAALGTLSTGCAADGADPDTDANVEAESVAAPVKLHGRFRFALEASRRAAIHDELAKKLSGAELDQAMKDVDAEADASVLEFGDDGHFVSWIGDKAILEGDYVATSTAKGALDVTVSGKTLRLGMPDDDTIIVHDPDKGALRFERE